ncbi:hypothetical protein MKW98_031871 [Papaver atlanticum]|uniref:Two-component response regulator n=1 Tax=Papaver atlanticum TaxID=357466 RepID=A0AAD4SDR8_9MAGN|nr:hypothetical protein MKW98_031871 [Papaver atlanticum]
MEKNNEHKFPERLRVLIVDDSPSCLKFIEGLLKSCRYEVTKETSAESALNLLRENKNNFDIVITDVQLEMGKHDGFKLLEIIGLQMDIPVIMMSSSNDYETVMKGVKHGACDYIVKPASLKEIQNIYQHVLRKNKSSVIDQKSEKQEIDRNSKKRNNNQMKNNEDDTSSHSSDEQFSTHKRARIAWDLELHGKFLAAFEKLGPDKAVPSKILSEMGVPGLTREKIASHLQKYRNYLKKNREQKYSNNIRDNGINGHLRNSTFDVSYFGNRESGIHGNSGLSLLSHHSMNPNPMNRSFVSPQTQFHSLNQHALPQHQFSYGRAANQNYQRSQVRDPLMTRSLHNQTYLNGLKAQTFSSGPYTENTYSKIPEHNTNIDSRVSSFPLLGGTPGLPNNNLFDVPGYLMPDGASLSNLTTVFHNDSMVNMVHTSLSAKDEMKNIIPLSVPSSNAEECPRIDHISSLEELLETDAFCNFSSSSSTDEDLSAVFKRVRHLFA